MHNFIKYIFIITLPVVFLCCSDQKTEYEAIQKIQDECARSIQRTSDYDLKIKSCDDAISSLQGFISKNNEGEWSNVAKTALSTWQENKESLIQKFKSLTDMLNKKMNARAVEVAKNLHPGSEIEKIQLTESNSRKEPDRVVTDAIYSVKMRGKIFGIHVFNFIVKVSGHIATDSNKVLIDNFTIEE